MNSERGRAEDAEFFCRIPFLLSLFYILGFLDVQAIFRLV
jgi:hypothetical protein